MLKQIKNWFRKPQATPARVPVAAPRTFVEPPVAVAKVETAPLSLAAILSRLPDDLKSTIQKMPEPEVLVALPLTTIVKQLPSGSVKMSFASLHRQSPAGTFNARPVEAKRLIEVPLAEIFKRVSPAVLRRRDDQRALEVADGFDLFGDGENPYAISPTLPQEREEYVPVPDPEPEPIPALKMPAPMVAAPPLGVAPALKPEPAAPMRTLAPPPAFAPKTQPRAVATPAAAAPAVANQPKVAPPTLAAAPKAAPAEASTGSGEDRPPVVVSLTDLASSWPDEVRSEIATLDQPTVALPSSEVGAGLAKGKVAFTWGQIRTWTTPAFANDTVVPDSMELSVPLRTIAPAYLKLSKHGSTRKSIAIDETMPALFGGGREKPAAPAPVVEPQPEPVVEAAPELEPEPAMQLAPPVREPEPELVPEAAPGREATQVFALEPTAPAHSVEEPKNERFFFADETTREPERAAPAAEAPQPVLTPDRPAPLPIAPIVPMADGQIPQTVGEIFGQPDKTEWKPAEIVDNIVRLPQIAGAIVALQEGLVVAHRLPEGMKGEVVAAFLPQIFARLNQYASEMKLGELDDLLFSTHGAHMQIFRLGYVFFAVLGKPGEALPWHELNLISQELSRHVDR